MTAAVQPMAPSQRARAATLMATVKTCTLCGVYIAISATLINFNKFLVSKDRFPYPVQLTTIHVIITFCTCGTFYFACPSMYPSMERAWGARSVLAKSFVPVAVLFILGVVCSNTAYLYCSVSFLQFMKEWNVALVFLFSCLAGSQACDRVKFSVIIWIMVGACLAVTGDMSFSRFGFLIQLGSQLGETVRIVVQEWLLSGSNLKLDPLTYQIFSGPPTLALLALVNLYTWDANVLVALQTWWPYLLANGFCAVALNITIAITIQSAGGVAFVLSGVVKDIVIVTASAHITGTWLNYQQTSGFTVALGGILFWGMMKAMPEHPMVTMLETALCMPPQKPKDVPMPAECKPLLSKDNDDA